MPIDVSLTARSAFDQARKAAVAANAPFPEHLLGMAEVLVPLGVDHIQSETGFDPNAVETALATAAVVEYVRARLLGLAVDADEAFNVALLRWRAAAGREAALFTDGSGWDVDELAAISVREAYRGNSKGAHADDLAHAVVYVGMAAAQMSAETGFDPVLVEPALSAEAAIHFSRSRLQGSRPENDDAYTAAYSRWRRAAAQSQEVDAFDAGAARDVQTLARLALSQASRGGRRGHSTDDLTEAANYVEQGVVSLASSCEYDPDVDATQAADVALVEYARISLLGGFAGSSPSFLTAQRAWQRQAAVDHHSDHAETYPAHPDVRRRLRRQETSNWREDLA